MLTMVTGQPGNGKTLYTLQMVEAMRVKEPHRPVYQHGIVGLTLPWLELEEAREWFGCPEGSIIVIDEAWKPFPVRKQGSQVPAYVEEFATHRHHGFDIFLITQHRHQLDTFVRKMVGRHIHLVRKFGRELSAVYQWEREVDPISEKERETAIKTDWEFPAHVYAWYKSAEVHTVKKDFPWRRFWWFPLLVVGLVVGLYFTLHRIRHLGDSAVPQSKLDQGKRLPGAAGGLASASTWSAPAAIARAAWLPGSASRYDGVYRIVSAPYIAGCMELQQGMSVSCRCADQAGADLHTPLSVCLDVVKFGVFDPSRKYDDAKAQDVAYLNATRSAQPDQGSAAAPGGGGAAAAPARPGS